jgi:hypothetical protein
LEIPVEKTHLQLTNQAVEAALELLEQVLVVLVDNILSLPQLMAIPIMQVVVVAL